VVGNGCPYAVGEASGRVYVACQGNWLGSDQPVPQGPGDLRAYDEATGTLLSHEAIGPIGQSVLVSARSEQVFAFTQHQLTILDGHSLGLHVQQTGGEGVPAPAACCGARSFPQTHHNLTGPFLAFWRRYGGLDTLGYPLTEPFVQGARWVQVTERFLLQYAGGRVSMAPLGRILSAGRTFAPITAFASTADRRYFPGTGHSLSGRFLAYWQSHNGAVLLGAPISEVVREQNGDGSGRRYQLQWFENGRLEYHPELASSHYAVEVGLAGRQYLRQLG
jgi:hypothetical protein